MAVARPAVGTVERRRRKLVWPSAVAAVLCLLVVVFLGQAVAGNADGDTAVVTVYSHSAAGAQETLAAIRVMMKTVELTRTKRDRVVLVSSNTPDDVLDVLKGDGIKILVSEGKAPFGAQAEPLRRKCPDLADWVELYSLGQYARLVYVAPEVLVLLSLDDLFYCGRFCITYANLRFWSAGVVVLRPNLAELGRLAGVFGDQAEELAEEGSAGSGLTCQQEFWRFLSSAYPGLSGAPLFDPERETRSEEPVERLSLMYELPALYHYEYFHWAHYQINVHIPAKSRAYAFLRPDELLPQNPTTGAHYSVAPFFHVPVPTVTLSFLLPQPTSWFQSLFFSLNWYWHEVRQQLVPDAASEARSLLWSRLAVAAAMAGAGHLLLARLFASARQHSAAHPLSHSFSMCGFGLSPTLAADLSGTAVGVAVVGAVLSAAVVPLLPPITPPWIAWPMVFLFLAVGVHVASGLAVYMASTAQVPPPWRAQLVPLLLEFASLAVLQADIHVHFVEKVVVMGVLVFVCVLRLTQPFRLVARALIPADVVHGKDAPE